LQDDRPDLTAALIEFLADNRGRTSELYILGDLFELWIGDDLESALADTIASHLLAFSAAGSQVYLMHGNRDFLLGKDFAARCGGQLIHEPYTINSSQGPITLLHGDVLCTDDVDYQQFRTLVRSPAWQREFLSKSQAQRLAFAAQARDQSRQSTAAKSAVIMDVNSTAVLDFMSANAAVTILHGHTHRPGVHEMRSPEDNSKWQRIVLGDWNSQGWYVEISELGLKLNHFTIQA
jgi:UDP-2,3-diacylglucosamine hydrolase